uniref:Uncharacterized protein n=1 Tax=Sphaerodactylus townsendi TaxID=933632 RepID=A0ACB8EYC5_9SAUR
MLKSVGLGRLEMGDPYSNPQFPIGYPSYRPSLNLVIKTEDLSDSVQSAIPSRPGHLVQGPSMMPGGQIAGDMSSLHTLQQLVQVPGHMQSVPLFLLSQASTGQQGNMKTCVSIKKHRELLDVESDRWSLETSARLAAALQNTRVEKHVLGEVGNAAASPETLWLERPGILPHGAL